jgi:hypothetical protein
MSFGDGGRIGQIEISKRSLPLQDFKRVRLRSTQSISPCHPNLILWKINAEIIEESRWVRWNTSYDGISREIRTRDSRERDFNLD